MAAVAGSGRSDNLDASRKAALSDAFSSLPEVKDARIVDTGTLRGVDFSRHVAVEFDYEAGSRYLIIAEKYRETPPPSEVARHYSKAIAKSIEINS